MSGIRCGRWTWNCHRNLQVLKVVLGKQVLCDSCWPAGPACVLRLTAPPAPSPSSQPGASAAPWQRAPASPAGQDTAGQHWSWSSQCSGLPVVFTCSTGPASVSFVFYMPSTPSALSWWPTETSFPILDTLGTITSPPSSSIVYSLLLYHS